MLRKAASGTSFNWSSNFHVWNVRDEVSIIKFEDIKNTCVLSLSLGYFLNLHLKLVCLLEVRCTNKIWRDCILKHLHTLSLDLIKNVLVDLSKFVH